MSHASPNAGGRRPELDGLRSIAILLVMAQHYLVDPLSAAPQTPLVRAILLPGGLAWSGVDLFFVLSGYLVGGILIAHRDASTFFRTFYIRRAFRILPLYLVFLAVCWLLAPPVWHVPRPPLFPYLTFLQNFWMAAAGTLGPTALAVTWSLAVEEQFYLTLPAMIRLVDPARLWRVLAFCIMGAPLVRLVLNVAFGEAAVFASHVLLFTRMDTLMLGVLVAWLQHRRIAIPRRLLDVIWLVSLAGVAAWRWNASARPIPLLWAVFTYDVVAVFYASTLLIVLRGGFRFLRHRALAYTGLISYALYLLHEPVDLLLHRMVPVTRTWQDLLLIAAAFVVTYALAALSWQLMEKPLVARGHRYRYAEAPAGPESVDATIAPVAPSPPAVGGLA